MEVAGRTIVVNKAFWNYGGSAGVHYLQNVSLSCSISLRDWGVHP